MDLPPEVVGHIFQFLPLPDVFRARRVSSQWSIAFRCIPNSSWKRILADYPGGQPPNTKKGRKTPPFFFAMKTMNEFRKFVDGKRYEEALFYATRNGHHALINQLFK